MSKALIAQILAQRESKFEVVPGRWLKIRRPAEVEAASLRVTVEGLQSVVVGWEAFTEADLLGSTVGSDSAVVFSFEVFSLWAADHQAEFIATWNEVTRLVREHSKAKGDTEKN
jgi:hypothetical protein